MKYQCILIYISKGNGKRHIPSRDRPSLRIPERERKKMFGDKCKRAEKKAKREQAIIKARENPVIAILSGEDMLDHMILRKTCIIHTQSGDGSFRTTSQCARQSPRASTSRASGSEGAKMNDEKLMQAVLVIDGALAGVLAFYSIPAALFMMALLVYAAINL